MFVSQFIVDAGLNMFWFFFSFERGFNLFISETLGTDTLNKTAYINIFRLFSCQNLQKEHNFDAG